MLTMEWKLLNIRLMIKLFFRTILILALSNSHWLSAQDLWPFRDASNTVVRGIITGLPGEPRYTSDNTISNIRFHGGVDMTQLARV